MDREPTDRQLAAPYPPIHHEDGLFFGGPPDEPRQPPGWDCGKGSWDRWAQVELTQTDEVADQVEEARAWGAAGVWLVPAGLGGDPWPEETWEELHRSWPQELAVGLIEGAARPESVRATLRVWGAQGGPPGRGSVLGLSPVDRALVTANPPERSATLGLIRDGLAQVANGLLWVDGAEIAERGGDPELEIGYILAGTADSIRLLIEAGLSPEDACRAVEVATSLGRGVVSQIAKVRALRWTLRMLVAALGSSSSVRCRLHGRTPLSTQTLFDRENNVLRGTLEAMAGILGGCDTVAVRPFDDAAARFDPAEAHPTGSRLALATQRILELEAALGRVADPAAGSWAIEAKTRELARAGWSRFRSIERAGGALRWIAKGRAVEALEEGAERRAAGVADGSLPIVGVTDYPDPTETLPTAMAAALLAHADSASASRKRRDAEGVELDRVRSTGGGGS